MSYGDHALQTSPVLSSALSICRPAASRSDEIGQVYRRLDRLGLSQSRLDDLRAHFKRLIALAPDARPSGLGAPSGRWTLTRKMLVVLAVRFEVVGRGAAQDALSMTAEELDALGQGFDLHGPAGLRTTKLNAHRAGSGTIPLHRSRKA